MWKVLVLQIEKQKQEQTEQANRQKSRTRRMKDEGQNLSDWWLRGAEIRKKGT